MIERRHALAEIAALNAIEDHTQNAINDLENLQIRLDVRKAFLETQVSGVPPMFPQPQTDETGFSVGDAMHLFGHMIG